MDDITEEPRILCLDDIRNLDKDKLYYLASPYTHRNKIIMKTRYETVNIIGGLFISAGLLVIEPIVSGHSKIDYGLPTNYDFWKEQCRKFVKKCDTVIVVMMPGWESSVGVSDEIQYAKDNNIPVYYLDPYKGQKTSKL